MIRHHQEEALRGSVHAHRAQGRQVQQQCEETLLEYEQTHHAEQERIELGEPVLLTAAASARCFNFVPTQHG